MVDRYFPLWGLGGMNVEASLRKLGIGKPKPVVSKRSGGWYYRRLMMKDHMGIDHIAYVGPFSSAEEAFDRAR